MHLYSIYSDKLLRVFLSLNKTYSKYEKFQENCEALKSYDPLFFVGLLIRLKAYQ